MNYPTNRHIAIKMIGLLYLVVLLVLSSVLPFITSVVLLLCVDVTIIKWWCHHTGDHDDMCDITINE
jgi:hypothetical protein